MATNGDERMRAIETTTRLIGKFDQDLKSRLQVKTVGGSYMFWLNHCGGRQLAAATVDREDGRSTLNGREKSIRITCVAGTIWRGFTDEVRQVYADASTTINEMVKSRTTVAARPVVRTEEEVRSKMRHTPSGGAFGTPRSVTISYESYELLEGTIQRLQTDLKEAQKEKAILQMKLDGQDDLVGQMRAEFAEIKSDYEKLEGVSFKCATVHAFEIQHYRTVVPREERLTEWKRHVGWISEEEFKAQWMALVGDIDGAMALKTKYDNQPKIPEHLVETPVVEESDEDDAEEDASTDVSIIEYEGKDYLVNPGNNEVYDFYVYQESEQIVTIGTWDPVEKKVALM